MKTLTDRNKGSLEICKGNGWHAQSLLSSVVSVNVPDGTGDTASLRSVSAFKAAVSDSSCVPPGEQD